MEPPQKRPRLSIPPAASSSGPSSSSSSAPILSAPLSEIFRIPNPEGHQNQEFLGSDNQNQEHGEANQNGHDEGNQAQQNDAFGVALAPLMGNLQNPVQENRIILGVSSTAGFHFSAMVNAFSTEFAGVAVVATDHAMDFLYRHDIGPRVYTDQDSVTYFHTHYGLVNLYEDLCSWATHICVFANASTCSKLATGNFDDLLTTTISNFGGNVHIVPVMSVQQRMSVPIQARLNELLIQGFYVYQHVHPPADNASLIDWVLHPNVAI